MTVSEVREKLEEIYDDYRNGTLKELNAIKHVGINEEKDTVVLIVEVSEKGSKAEEELRRKLAKVVKIDLGFSGIRIQFEESKTVAKIAGKSTKFIFIAGLKGGVGKSTITINLAYALKNLDKRVGIIDADVYNASIAKMLEMKDENLNVDEHNKIIPFHHKGIEIISTDFFSEAEEPLMWRGSMLSSMVNNYIFQVAWNKNTDYILVDLPSDTGDILMDIATYIPDASVIIVSEDDRLSAYQTLKTYKAIKELNLNVIGIVINKYQNNNASKYLLDKCKDIEILATIPYSKPNNNYEFENENIKNIFNDLATIIDIN